MMEKKEAVKSKQQTMTGRRKWKVKWWRRRRLRKRRVQRRQSRRLRRETAIPSQMSTAQRATATATTDRLRDVETSPPNPPDPRLWLKGSQPPSPPPPTPLPQPLQIAAATPRRIAEFQKRLSNPHRVQSNQNKRQSSTDNIHRHLDASDVLFAPLGSSVVSFMCTFACDIFYLESACTCILRSKITA
uniref:Uncharacterized protein n=1 Tax=Mesocestoides corti TaxID=53468 RepID=A0A5K3FQP8_MESCO